MTIYFESKSQMARNKQTGQRPPGVSDEEWFWSRWYSDHCHWYDKQPDHRYGSFGLKRESQGHCCGMWRHDHTPVIMKLYWKSPLALVIPPLYFTWELWPLIMPRLLEKLGWYWLLERFGVDTSPQ